MNTYTHYFLELSLIWAVLLLFYHVAFRGSGDWTVRRRYLLLSWAFGLLLPALPALITLGPVAAEQLPAQVVTYLRPAAVPTVSPGAQLPSEGMSLLQLAGYLWLAGTVTLGGVAALRLAVHLRPRPTTGERFAGFTVVRHYAIDTPYAAAGRIYLPTDLDPALERTALLHEAAHLRHGHFAERLLLLLGCCALWWHPLVWLYARWLGNVHEYQADAAVAREVPVPTYGRQLLDATQAARLVPGLFSSPLQQRIRMLTQPNTHSLNLAQWSLLFLLIGGLFLACSSAASLDGGQSNEMVQQEVDKPPVLRGTPDTMDGTEYLIRTIYSTIAYPDAAREAGETGQVKLAMPISAAGILGEAVVLADFPEGSAPTEVVIVGYNSTGKRSDYPGAAADDDPLNAEVLKMAKRLGTIGFEPATKDGKAVSTTLYYQFTYKLE